jgi:hypothetical protein
MKRAVRDAIPKDYDFMIVCFNMIATPSFLGEFLDASTVPALFKIFYTILKRNDTEFTHEVLLLLQKILENEEGFRKLLMSRELISVVLEFTYAQDLNLAIPALEIMIELACDPELPLT